MSDQVGKFAKGLGRMHPSMLRKLEPVPPKVTPKAVSRPKKLRRFSFESRSRYTDYVTKEWRPWGRWRRAGWYATTKRRDQAMANYHGYFVDPGRSEIETRPLERE